MVTLGKSRSPMGWVVIEVAIGFSCHSLYDLAIRIPAAMNPIQTTKNQRTFADLVWKNTDDDQKREKAQQNLPQLKIYRLGHVW